MGAENDVFIHVRPDKGAYPWTEEKLLQEIHRRLCPDFESLSNDRSVLHFRGRFYDVRDVLCTATVGLPAVFVLTYMGEEPYIPGAVRPDDRIEISRQFFRNGKRTAIYMAEVRLPVDTPEQLLLDPVEVTALPERTPEELRAAALSGDEDALNELLEASHG